ncbi:MAG: lytic transglycosylase domain-containing protein [Deltaproteobacteria bacterium]|nr:MAG: lytic transglycosylase domain-containing protein [Deltaproteobacteria bacterium]
MRLRPCVLGLFPIVLAACGPLGRVDVPVPECAPATAPVAAPAPRPSPITMDLACFAHPEIDVWERRLRFDRPLWADTLHALSRGAAYLPHLRDVFSEGGMPSSLALLPAIESGFGPRAQSASGSRGLWQFKASTARRFGLVVTRKRDDRLEPDLATRAAARYLAVLHAHYDDWPLAIAAYNAGEGRVDRARRRDPGASFWQLTDDRRLPRASLDYVARFLALVRVVDGATDC